MNFSVIVAIILSWNLGEMFASASNSTNDESSSISGSGAVHSRQKRYIVFPKGSSLQLLLELLIHVPTQFRVVVGPTLQVAWSLPSEPLSKMTPDVSTNHDPNKQTSRYFSFRNSKFSAEKLTGRRKYPILRKMAAFMDSFGTTIGLAWQLPDDPEIYSEFKKKHKIYKRNVLKKAEGFMRPGGANGQQCVLRALCESGQRTPAKKEFLREIMHKIFSYDAENDDLEETHEDKIYRKAHQSANQDCESLYPECGFSIFNAIN